MESNILYKNESLELCEDYIDVGYMADNFTACSSDLEPFEFTRSHKDKSMTLLVSFPNKNELYEEELLLIDALLNEIQVDIYCYAVFHKELEKSVDLQKKLSKFTIIYDTEDEFGNMYGTKIVSGSLKDQLTKSLFLISKDGAVFYLELPKNIEDKLDLQRLRVELNKAYITYNGVGCHG